VNSGSGGAVLIGAACNHLYFMSSSFAGNRAAVYGGAVRASQVNAAINFATCTFNANKAQNGGAVSLGVGNGDGLTGALTTTAVTFSAATFAQNQATVAGGAVHLLNLNCAQFADSTFTLNTAGQGDGGALFLGALSNFVSIEGSTLTGNYAGKRGGALASETANDVTLGSTVMGNNRAGTEGGAVFAGSGSAVRTHSTAVFQVGGCGLCGCSGSGSGCRGYVWPVNGVHVIAIVVITLSSPSSIPLVSSLLIPFPALYHVINSCLHQPAQPMRPHQPRLPGRRSGPH
jgi:predicted outer membrane repeat protein